MAEQFSIPTVGDLIAGKYRVETELGRGAYGVVFRADQKELGRHVAVKTLLPQAFLQKDIVQRFQREAQLISRLDHPNIIRLYDYGVDEGLLYMAVEFVEGRTLMDVIEGDAPLDPERVRELALQILDALEHAHSNGIVHRDLKPDNIILLQTKTSDGQEYEVVKILDFGISKLLIGENEAGALKSLTQDGTVLGTPHYMSPENIVGDPIDHRADLYAFGVILYEMIIGKHPFDAPSPSAVMVRHLRDAPPELPEPLVSSALGVAVGRCLEKQPWDRIGSARELIEILETPLGELPRLSRPQSGRRQPAPPSFALPDPDSEATVVRDDVVSRAPTPKVGPGVAGAMVAGVILALLLLGWQVRRALDAASLSEPEPAIATPAVEAPRRPLALVETEPDVGPSGAMIFAASPADAGTEQLSDEPPAPQEPVAPAGTVDTVPPQERDPQPRARRRAAEAEAAEVAPEAIEMAFSSEPTGASLMIDGSPAGVTPVTRTLSAGKTVQVRFKHIGYKPKTMSVTPGPTQTSVRANLEKDQLRLID